MEYVPWLVDLACVITACFKPIPAYKADSSHNEDRMKITGKCGDICGKFWKSIDNPGFLSQIFLMVIRHTCTDSMYQVRCASGFYYLEDTDMCIELVRRSWRFDKAQRLCKAMTNNASLAIPNDSQKLNAIQRFLMQEGFGTSVFVGGKRQLEGKYYWLNGDRIEMSWCPGQPSSQDRCVSLWAAKGFCLDDTRCSDLQPFICEAPAIKI